MEEPRIIYENNSLAVVIKPSGLIVNKADTTKDEKTLQDWAENQFKIHPYQQKDTEPLVQKGELEDRTDDNSDFYNRAGIVHRLDKETSGIILIAKTPEAFKALQKQFKERIVKKEYIALAHGNVIPPEGEINAPVGRLEFNRKRFGVVAGGREALTKYKVLTLKRSPDKRHEILSLLRLYPETGRTHQIRVHLKYLNHPIVADELYAGRKTAREDRKLLPRLFLHAAKISFINPVDNKELILESELPEDLATFYTKLV